MFLLIRLGKDSSWLPQQSWGGGISHASTRHTRGNLVPKLENKQTT
jgi:hypothetical protein